MIGNSPSSALLKPIQNRPPMSTTDAFLEQLHRRLAADARVEAAWLSGSFGRGDADRYSDIDLNLLLAAEGASFRRDIQGWLAALRPLVLYTLLFDGRMVNALTVDGVRLDIWLHEQPIALERSKTRLLFDRHDRIGSQAEQAPASAAAAPGDAAKTAAELRRQIEEFWRCIALLPAVIGREEWIVAWRGLAVEFDLVQEMLLRGYRIVRDGGAKKLNQFLPPPLREELEAALNLPGLSPGSLVDAHLALAALVRRHGRSVAERWGFDYPTALEEAVLRYAAQELGLQGIDIDKRKSIPAP